MQNPDLETLVAEFEDVFDVAHASRIDEFAARYSGNRETVIEELVHTELELRLKAGDSARLEHYLEVYPELATKPNFVEDLMRTEFVVRSRYETGLSISEYVVRFPNSYKSLLDAANQKAASRGIGEDSFSRSFSDESSRFRKIKLLQQGGLGNVWLADDQELGRPVALKEIKDKYAKEEEHQKRFVNEAIITGSLEHPSIVPVYGLGKFHSGSPYYAMRMVQGESLQSAVQDFHSRDAFSESRNVAFRRLLQHFLNLCGAIQFAHEHGVLHRDIKPSNLMIGALGQTIVVDWGLATIVDSDSFPAFDQLQSVPEEAGSVAGSPAFMSPEQASGSTEKQSQRSDVYSLGATLLCIATGLKNPNSTLREDTVSNPTLFAGKAPRNLEPLVSICRKAMATNPDDRYQSAHELANDVERFLADERVNAHSEPSLERLSRLSRKHRGIFNTVGMAAIVIACLSTAAALLINNSLQQTVAAKSDLRTLATDTLLGFDFFGELFSSAGACGLEEDLTLLQGLEKLKSQLDSMPPRVQAMMHEIFALNHAGGLRMEHAFLEFDEAIKIADKHYGADNVLTVRCTANKVILLQNTGQDRNALRLAKPILKKCESDPEKYKDFYYRLLSAVGTIEIRRENFKEASKLIEKSYQLALEKYDDESHSHCVQIKSLKIAILRKQNNFKDAAAEAERLLKTARELEQDHTDVYVRLLTETARTKLDLAISDSKSGVGLKEIIQVFEEALELERELRGPDHFKSKMVEYDIAKAKYRHSQATLKDLNDSVDSLRAIREFVSEKYPMSDELPKIEKAIGRATFKKEQAEAKQKSGRN